ncbi:MAG: GxxExxY protein [Bacteroidetes bacterium]|jgi:GxxExxY protein|nr:GxxExxY protein [Bacteroidota bacterium]
MSYLHEQLTERVIRCFYEVYNELGYGFLEKVYEQSLMIRLRECELPAVRQMPISVQYHGYIVGNYAADILVDQKVIVEIKAVEHLVVDHEYQLINYLRATDVEVGLLLNFGPKPEVRRKVFANERKSGLRKRTGNADDAEKGDLR